eukprot:1146101-Amphidinium_carterae.1
MRIDREKRPETNGFGVMLLRWLDSSFMRTRDAPEDKCLLKIVVSSTTAFGATHKAKLQSSAMFQVPKDA